MQFRLQQTHRYWWPVRVRVPAREAGTFEEQELRLQFEPLPRDKALDDQDEAATLTTLRARAEHEVEQYMGVVKGWDGVVDDDGEVVPFTKEDLRQALQHSWFRDAVSRALAESLHGDAARLGN